MNPPLQGFRPLRLASRQGGAHARYAPRVNFLEFCGHSQCGRDQDARDLVSRQPEPVRMAGSLRPSSLEGDTEVALKGVLFYR